MKTKAVKLNEIVIDAGTQQRENINDAAVEEYAEALRCGAKFPAVSLFFDGARYYLADGFHRYWAHKAVEGMLDILADVYEGTKREAVLFSASANGAHGIRLSNSDKRKSVLVLLLDKEWSQWSDNQIAKHCHVTQPFVSKLRKEFSPQGVITVITPPRKPNKDAGVTFELPKKEATDQDETYTETDHLIDQLRGSVSTLSEENDRLANIAAAKVFDGSDEDRAELLGRLDSLVAENKQLRIELDAVKSSRDGYQRENAQLKNQLRMQRKQLGMAA